jgi:hypothetical protein
MSELLFCGKGVCLYLLQSAATASHAATIQSGRNS